MLKALPMATIGDCHQPGPPMEQLRNTVHGTFLNTSCHQGNKDGAGVDPNPSCIYSSCRGNRQYPPMVPPQKVAVSDNTHAHVYNSHQQQPVYDFGDDDEDIDEDDIEDDDEFVDDDEEEMDTDSSVNDNKPQENEVTQQLLTYLEMVNSDIKKYFGKRSGEDSCDIFEDKWTSGKSGRELYYADLVRIAQCGDISDEPKISGIGKEDVPCSGKLDRKAGLGPFRELFEPGCKRSTSKHIETSRKAALDKHAPMKDRNLPKSFFKEPVRELPASGKTLKQCANSRTVAEARPGGVPGAATSTKHPDFSDLLESWTREDIAHLTASHH
jgi:hypothetical protein